MTLHRTAEKLVPIKTLPEQPKPLMPTQVRNNFGHLAYDRWPQLPDSCAKSLTELRPRRSHPEGTPTKRTEQISSLMAETKDSIKQQDLDPEDKQLLRQFGNWLREDSTQFQTTATGLKHCTDARLQEKTRDLFKLSCLKKQVS